MYSSADRTKGALVFLVAFMFLSVGIAAVVAADHGSATRSGVNVRINDDDSQEFQQEPDMAIAPDGTLFAVWQDSRLGEWNIYISWSSNKGDTWGDGVKNGNDVMVNYYDPNNATSQIDPCIAVDTLGRLYVAWEDDRSGAFNIRYAYSDDGGVSWHNDSVVDSATLDQRDPDIAIGPENTVYITYDEGPHSYKGRIVKVSASTDRGASFLPPVIANDDMSEQSKKEPRIAVTSQGAVVVVFEDYRNGNSTTSTNPDIYCAYSFDSGTTFGANVRVNDDTAYPSQKEQKNPNICADGMGSVAVVWEDGRDNDRDNFLSLSFDGGKTFTANHPVCSDRASRPNERSPAVSLDTHGNIYCVWVDSSDGDNLTYTARSLDGGLTFTPAQLFDNTRDYGWGVTDSKYYEYSWMEKDNPEIAMDASRLYACWEDYREDNWPPNWIPENPDIYSNKTTLSHNTAPNKPVLDATAVSYNEILLSWDMCVNPDLKKYELFGSSYENVSLNIGARILSTTDRSRMNLTLDGLDPNTTYYFRLKVEDQESAYAVSDEVSATTFANMPPTFAFITPVQGTTVDNVLNVSWSASDPEEDACISLYLDDDRYSGGETFLGNFSEDTDTNYTLDTSQLPEGFYYLNASIDDSVNTISYTYSTTFEVDHFNPDEVPAYVLSTDPTQGANDVHVNSTISVLFSRSMDPASLTGKNITLSVGSTAVGFGLDYDDALHQLTVTPMQRLEFTTPYTLKLNLGVRDTYGNMIDGNGDGHSSIFNLHFTTEENTYHPIIIAHSPTGGDNDLAVRITATFDRDMDPATLGNGVDVLVQPRGTTEALVGATGYDNATRTLSFTPSHLLSFHTIYDVTVKTCFLSMQGYGLADDIAWDFFTLENIPSDDYDGDGIENGEDAFPTDPAASSDYDGDGHPDELNGTSTTGLVEDTDDDNDGYPDINETAAGSDPRNNLSTLDDKDADGVPVGLDRDDLDPKVGEGTANSGSWGQEAWLFIILVLLVLVALVAAVLYMRARSKRYDDELESKRKEYSATEFTDYDDDEIDFGIGSTKKAGRSGRGRRREYDDYDEDEDDYDEDEDDYDEDEDDYDEDEDDFEDDFDEGPDDDFEDDFDERPDDDFDEGPDDDFDEGPDDDFDEGPDDDFEDDFDEGPEDDFDEGPDEGSDDYHTDKDAGESVASPHKAHRRRAGKAGKAARTEKAGKARGTGKAARSGKRKTSGPKKKLRGSG